MTAFSKDFDPTRPTGSERANTADDQFRDDKTAVNERLSLEHYDLTNDVTKENMQAPGRAIPGVIGVVRKGTTVERSAFSQSSADGQTIYNRGNGALWYDTTDATLYRWDGTSETWEAVGRPNSTTSSVTVSGLPAGYPKISAGSSTAALATMFGLNCTGVRFSTTRTALVSLFAVRNSTTNVQWGFMGTINSGVMDSSGTNDWLQSGFGVASSATLEAHAAGDSCQVWVPAGYYFRFRVIRNSYFYNFAGEVNAITGAEISAGFTIFNVGVCLI